MKTNKSQELFKEARRHIPGGVNSPVRAFKAVGGNPLFIDHGKGSRIYDVDGNDYIDYVLSWGPLILGHAHLEVIEAIKHTAELGTSFGAPTQLEIRLAQEIKKAYPSMEMIRAVNSGTEAAMSAIRASRGFHYLNGGQRRDKIIKFEGCYHGHSDGLLSKAGSGLATLGIPDCPGVSQSQAADTITLPYNDISAVEAVIKDAGRDIAAVIVEPVAGNMGCVPPKPGFLEGLRKLTKQNGIILIFDEVMTGFRAAYGGAQALYGVKPDMTCLGKVIGGGLPVGVYGGSLEIMSNIAPQGTVYQAGTLSGNPLAMAAGLKTLEILCRPGAYETLERRSIMLEEGLRDSAKRAGAVTKFYRVGTMFCSYFTGNEVYDWESAKLSDTKRFGRYFGLMLEHGINIAPSQFEAGFLSSAHSEGDIEETVRANYESLIKSS